MQNRKADHRSRLGVWESAAIESLKLCRKCSGLTKHTHSLKYLLSSSGIRFLIELEALKNSARKGCPLCRTISSKLQSLTEETLQLQYLHRRSPKTFTRNIVKRQTKSYKAPKLLYLRIRVPWNDFSGKNQPLTEDFMGIEMHYKVPKWVQLAHSLQDVPKWDRLLEFDVCAVSGDAMADMISARPLTEDMDSVESFTLAKDWIQECCFEHNSCPNVINNLPSRVIDVGGPETVHPPLLLLTQGVKAPYVALSYCWGQPPSQPQPPQPVMTTTRTINEFTNALPVRLLPPTIKDAIYTTRQLGFRYLWVDVLCILQDDKVDKRKEISKMKEIFSNAVVTISASCSDSCHTGFLYKRPLYHDSLYHRSMNTKPPYVCVEYPPYILPFRCPNGKLGSLILHRWMTTIAPHEPIHDRAWTLEERLLSGRVLVYGPAQLRWECQAGMKMQGADIFEMKYQPRLKQVLFNYNRDRPSHLLGELTTTSRPEASWEYTTPSAIAELNESWKEIVMDYTRRKLTFVEDRLIAISGIAAVFASGFNSGQYKAGIWFTEREQYHFLQDLLWSTNDNKANKHCNQPSWTWAAVDGGVNWPTDGQPAYWRSKSDPVCRILECSVVLESEDAPFGKVTGGLLKIMGPLKRFQTITRGDGYSQGVGLDVKGTPFGEFQILDSNNVPIPTFSVFLDTANAVMGNEEEAKHSTVWALLLLRSMGLLLQTAEMGTFKRVGMFSWNDDEQWFGEEDLRNLSTVTIV